MELFFLKKEEIFKWKPNYQAKQLDELLGYRSVCSTIQDPVCVMYPIQQQLEPKSSPTRLWRHFVPHYLFMALFKNRPSHQQGVPLMGHIIYSITKTD